MTISIKLKDKVSYIDYIGVMTLLRTYPRITLLCFNASGKWFEALKKQKGIIFIERTDIDPIVSNDTYIVKSNTITLDRFIDLPKRETIMTEGHLLFSEDIHAAIFNTPGISHIQNIPTDLNIDPEYIAKNENIYSQFVRKLLPERTWNFYNDSVWGLSSEKPLPLRKRDKVFRFHLLGLHHLPTSEEYMSCAFTQKNVKMCKMLLNMGHEVYLYGSEGSNAPCTKFIETHSLKDIRDAWGEGDNRFEIGYDWHSGQFRHDFNQTPTLTTAKARSIAINKINEIKKPDDFILVTQGYYHKPIADKVKLFLTVEPGIGYRGSYAPFRGFESTYVQYFTYGSEHPRQSINGAYYDRVIPNYYDTKDFPVTTEKGDYYLFMARLIIRKGLDTAIKAVKAIGGKLVVAGQKDPETEEMLKDPVVEYIGYADAKKRALLMGRAKAVFTPSTYLEPFCGVHAEAMLCGTPVITTNFGAFTDSVIDGLTGYKCNTLQDFVDATKEVEKLDPKIIRKYAQKFTLENVSLQYQRWFQDLYRVWESVDDPNKKAWHHVE